MCDLVLGGQDANVTISPSDGAATVSLRTKVRFPRNSPSKMVPWTMQLPPSNENRTRGRRRWSRTCRRREINRSANQKKQTTCVKPPETSLRKHGKGTIRW